MGKKKSVKGLTQSVSESNLQEEESRLKRDFLKPPNNREKSSVKQNPENDCLSKSREKLKVIQLPENQTLASQEFETMDRLQHEESIEDSGLASPWPSQSKKKPQCAFCETKLETGSHVFYVETEIGRSFCSEDCILTYFSSEIERLEMQYQELRPQGDFSQKQREELSHLKWSTLKQPKEIWREKTLSGDYRYTLISEFETQDEKVYSVAVSLFLNGEPSFMFIHFPTRSETLVEAFKKGEPLDLNAIKSQKGSQKSSKKDVQPNELHSTEEIDEPEEALYDGLAESWSADETLLSELRKRRSKEDIPQADFELYDECVEETLQEADEVWKNKRLYHFIKYFKEAEGAEFWYIVAAVETEDEDQLEIIDQIPSQDPRLVEAYRIGKQKLLQDSESDDDESHLLEDVEGSSTPVIH